MECGKATTRKLGQHTWGTSEDDQWAPLKDVHKVESQLHAAGKEVMLHVYPDARHWFFEKDRPGAYDSKAAQLAWKRTIAFFHKHLEH